MSTVPFPRASSDSASRRSSPSGSSSRVRAAASSMANGTPSRRRQISTTARAMAWMRAKSGRTAPARSTQSAAAGDDRRSSSAAVPGVGRQRERRHGVLPFGTQPQHRQAGREDRHPGAAGQQFAEVAGRVDQVLEVVEDQRPSAIAEALDQGRQRGVGAPGLGPHRPRDRGENLLGLRDAGKRDESRAGLEAVAQPLAHRQRQPGLADATRPGQRHQPRGLAPEQASHVVDRLLASDERRRDHAQGSRPARGRRRRGAGGRKALAQERREVLAYQSPELRVRKVR
jgi:hypothetical protein